MKSLVFYRSGLCNEQRVEENLKKVVDHVSIVYHKCRNNDMDPELAAKILHSIHSINAESVFSLDYYPIIAEVAHILGIPYISWIVDSPHFTLYSRTSLYDSSYIFHFDRNECERLKKLGRPNVFHMPLATDPEFFVSVINSKPENKMTDVSFLASSYQNKYNFFDNKKGLNEYDQGYIEGIIKTQLLVYGEGIVRDVLPSQMASKLVNGCEVKWPQTYDLNDDYVAESIIEKKISIIERNQIVSQVSDKYGITLYSECNALVKNGVDYRGYIDYESMMPLAFVYSRININSTLRNIHSGIPLRALDIMACRGFLLSNYQPELVEYFDEGKSIAMYTSMEELLEKTGWYLQHEEMRRRIAMNGYAIIIKYFDYVTRINEIFSHVCL